MTEERIRSLEIALAASRGAQQDMEEVLADIQRIVKAPLASDWCKLMDIRELVAVWGPDDD